VKQLKLQTNRTFGPTDAKIELFDVLSEDHRFVKNKS
jgi:hypothetical protein